MELSKIVQGINNKLAGEILPFDMLKDHLDDAIDDINTRLNSTFPVFSEFTSANYPERYPNYNFFPDLYIRKCVIIGSAYKFYTTDEEGIDTAKSYGYIYENGLFLMERDYLDQVPEEFKATYTGSVEIPELGLVDTPYRFNDLW